MATWQIFNSLKEAINEEVHNFASDTLMIALSNTAPVLTNTVLADITQISGAGTYAAQALAGISSSQTGGTYTLSFSTDETFTASGAAYDTFRYLVLYNDTATNDELIGYLDYGTGVTLGDGESFTLAAGTVFTLSSA